MTTAGAHSPHLKSLTPTTDRTGPAEPAPGPAAGGAPKVAAEGALSSVRPDPHPADERQPIAWLHIIAAPDWSMPPRAFSRCDCGRYESARGRARVLALIDAHTAHRDLCPLRRPASERNRAA